MILGVFLLIIYCFPKKQPTQSPEATGGLLSQVFGQLRDVLLYVALELRQPVLKEGLRWVHGMGSGWGGGPGHAGISSEL